MILICPACKKQHIINENKIPPNVKTVRCKFCHQLFALNINHSSTTAHEQAAPKTRMRKIGVTLSKGGVGKTTTAVNLAVGLAQIGKKILLIDTDTQGQASYMLGIKPAAGLTELMTDRVQPAEAVFKAREGLWVLSGGKSLAGVKRVIDRKDFGGEKTLSEYLAVYNEKYDYAIVDTSPGWDPLTVNVLFYVDEILAPVSLEVLTLQGLVEFLKSLATIQNYRDSITLRYILPTFLDNRVKKSESILRKLKDIYNGKVCTPIRYNVKISESPAYGQSIFEFDPESNGAKDYMALVRKVDENSQCAVANTQGITDFREIVNA